MPPTVPPRPAGSGRRPGSVATVALDTARELSHPTDAERAAAPRDGTDGGADPSSAEEQREGSGSAGHGEGEREHVGRAGPA